MISVPPTNITTPLQDSGDRVEVRTGQACRWRTVGAAYGKFGITLREFVTEILNWSEGRLVIVDLMASHLACICTHLWGGSRL